MYISSQNIQFYLLLYLLWSTMLWICSVNSSQLFCVRDEEQRSCWNEPSSVPACLLSSLETFEWVNYEGTEEEKEVVAFILRSGRCLKKVNISSETTTPTRNLSACTRLKPWSQVRSHICLLIFLISFSYSYYLRVLNFLLFLLYWSMPIRKF